MRRAAPRGRAHSRLPRRFLRTGRWLLSYLSFKCDVRTTSASIITAPRQYRILSLKTLHAMPCVGSLGSIQKPRSMQQIHWGKLRWSLGFILDSSGENNNILELFPICCRFCGPLVRRSSVPRSFGLPQDYCKLQYFQLLKATKAANYSICVEDCGCCIHFGI